MVEEWQVATLAEKIPPQALKQGSQTIGKILAREAKGLKMVSDFSLQRQWLQIRARGEDAGAFLNLLKREHGEAPLSRSNLEKWDVVDGFVTGAGRIGYGAQLADGEAQSSREILDGNGLVDYAPIRVAVTELDGENISVELADEQREQLVSWRKYPFDRVIVIGADKIQAENAVRFSGLQDDIVKVESLSLFVQSLLCKIGTDAPGVIAKIGNRLRGVGLKSYRTPTKL